MEKLSVRIGQRLKKLRHTAGYTQDKTAELAEISGKYLGEIERGEVQVSAQVLEKLAMVFQLSLAELVHIDATPNTQDLKARLLTLVQNASDADVRLLYRIYMAIQGECEHCPTGNATGLSQRHSKNCMSGP